MRGVKNQKILRKGNETMKEINTIIKEAGTNNPFEIAEHLGVIVRYDPLGQIQGYYLKAGDVKVVVINTDLSEHVRRFILAHELGHIVLHPYSTVFAMRHTLLVTDRQELEADRFAVNLLMPDDMIKANAHFTISQWASFIGLPEEVVQLRFEENYEEI